MWKASLTDQDLLQKSWNAGNELENIEKDAESVPEEFERTRVSTQCQVINLLKFSVIYLQYKDNFQKPVDNPYWEFGYYY